MKKRNIILIIIISITAIALGTVLLLFVTNHNVPTAADSVAEDNPYEAPGFEEDEALDENMNFIDKNKSSGTVGIISSFKTNTSDDEESNSTAEEPTAPSEGYMLGDVNLDGEINILDATQLQKMIVGLVKSTNESNASADVNGDNSVDIIDATLIQKYCAGLIDGFGSSAPTTEPTSSIEDTTSNTSASTSDDDTAELPPQAPIQNGEWGASVKN